MPGADRPRAGMSLVEVLVAMLLLSLLALAAAPMYYQATHASAAGADLGTVGALAVERMEQLRALPFSDLEDGGDLDADVPGYVDDSHEEAVVRWSIETNAQGTLKTIRVKAIARRAVAGRAKQVVLTSLRTR
ncbi:MAG: prepilin-type N-terminal cleavage/methylation domain-containing protein [Acidobacteria bacterium]|nr:MAG: prepilin-type N-terminal cleavage/methylation domain-containing protein [Acidobacteriota bacterium]